MRALRKHQSDAIQKLRYSLMSGKKRPMLMAPTGAGKTLLAAHIIQSALGKGKRVIFCVNAISLVDQTVKAFWAEGVQAIGVLQGNHEMTDRSKPVQVCSVQTLQNRTIPDADLVIIDEAHNWFKFYGKWMKQWDAVPFIGLSATPWTKGIGKHYDDLIIAATTQGLIDEGYLSPFRVFAPSHPDLKGVRTVAGDYHEGDLSKAMDKPPLIADIVRTWKERGTGGLTLCYGVDRAHAKHIQREFEAAGVPCGYIDAFTDIDERNYISDQYHKGVLKVVSNVGCLTTGIDWDVRCIILARPTKSKILFTQIVGRGLRTAEGKDFCTILDHSDTHLRLGFVTDIYIERLDDGKEKTSSGGKDSEPKLPKECKSCHALKPAGVHQCPACGFKPEKQTDVVHVDGELVELQSGSKAQRKNNRDATPEEKRFFYGGLKEYGRSMGYKEGWAANQYREKYGVWPNAYKDTPLIEPSAEVMNWVKHQRIKYAKRRQA